VSTTVIETQDEVSPRIRRFLDEVQPPTPCLVLDLDVVADRYRRLREALPVVEVQAKTLLQLVAGEDVMARVFGLLDGLASVAMLAGSLAAPLLVARIGLGAALVVVGVELPVLALLPLAAGRVAGRALAA
jgi:hypothetical protein